MKAEPNDADSELAQHIAKMVDELFAVFCVTHSHMIDQTKLKAFKPTVAQMIAEYRTSELEQDDKMEATLPANVQCEKCGMFYNPLAEDDHKKVCGEE